MTAAGAQRGFSLFEMAIVITIVGLLLALSAEFMGGYTERQQYKAASDKLSAIEQALVRYLSVTEHLPCPDTDGDGNENRASATACTNAVGTIPWIDLGITWEAASDVRANLIGYAVRDALVDQNAGWIGATGAVAATATTPAVPPTFTNLGFEVRDSTGATIMNPSPAGGTTMPTGAAYILMADTWYDDPGSAADETLAGTINGAGDTITLGVFAISELIRRPSVVQLYFEAELTP